MTGPGIRALSSMREARVFYRAMAMYTESQRRLIMFVVLQRLRVETNDLSIGER